MGIPYSREINAAFDQVTPLIAAGFQVLQTTKNISILLACIQVLTVVYLSLILLALIGLICVVNPALHTERDALVTPVVKWLASWVLLYGSGVVWTLRIGVVLVTAGLGVFFWQGSLAGTSVPGTPMEMDGQEQEAGDVGK
ncbi:hypothetical protein N0V93_004899 [Gnomoniopsis smithogilvyi]|uniref:Uncharacterized protein n=1 Tax=Gnomoniopsis smithogilvyi TaxID=1191159 RepID=A0A9W8YRW2_9PEZI|nr:hypothetical protein N0V93_004899 [Gnomoniopsis smithogilvyi]